MSQHVFSIRTNLIIFAILMALLVLTVAVALQEWFDFGIFEIPIALTIAMVKAVLIMMYFMHLKFSTRLTWLFAGSGLLWLVILIAFSLSDFLSRGWISPIIHEGPSREAAASYFGGLPDPDTYLSESSHGHSGDSVSATSH